MHLTFHLRSTVHDPEHCASLSAVNAQRLGWTGPVLVRRDPRMLNVETSLSLALTFPTRRALHGDRR